jgi:hypothetical protein
VGYGSTVLLGSTIYVFLFYLEGCICKDFGDIVFNFLCVSVFILHIWDIQSQVIPSKREYYPNPHYLFHISYSK